MGTKPLAFVFLALAGAAVAGSAMAACVGDDGTAPVVAGDGGPEASILPQGKANGIPCAAGSECTSAQCSDGVCCDAKCDGTCEKCNLPGTVGTCSAIPDGTDPETECPTTPLATPDAGTDTNISDAGGDAGDAGDSDAGAVDAGLPFNTPDGGLPATTPSQCAGHCNGKRACAYAGAETQCGTAFCGNSEQQGIASCDGAGHCLYGVQECSAYSCTDGSPGCRTSCSKVTDCLADFFCDGTSNTCKPKLANGVNCSDVTQCSSGICDPTAKLCCDADCSSTPGGTCNAPGKPGQCTCSACATGSCAIYYQDLDGDGHGNASGKVSDGSAKYACADAAPAGFAASHDDCLDSIATVAFSVHPGQTGYFTSPYKDVNGQDSFDYDCSGTAEKKTLEAASCGFCYNEVFQQKQTATPDLIYGFCGVKPNCGAAGNQAYRSCGGCTGLNAASFLGSVPCGGSGSSYTCGTCAAANGTALNVFAGTILQSCH